MADQPADSAAQDDATDEVKSRGLFASLRHLLATLIGTARTRLALLQVELEEEKLRLTGIAILAAAAAFFIALAIVVFTFFLVLLFWDTHRVLATGLIAATYLIIGIGLAVAARRRAAAKSTLFAASLAQLDADREHLTRE